MSRSSFAFASPARFGTAKSTRAGALTLLAALLLATPAASLPKTTTGASCSSTWVNNEGAMNCFIQGEDESHAGVKHPHYVTCDPGGDIFCCVDNDAGAQNCVATIATGHPTTEGQRIRALLAAQRAHLKSLGKSPGDGGASQSRAPGSNRKSSPP